MKQDYPVSTFVYTGPLLLDCYPVPPTTAVPWATEQKRLSRPIALITTGTAWGRELLITLAQHMHKADFSCMMLAPDRDTSVQLEAYANPYLFVLREARLSNILPLCDIVIHHAGHGTAQAVVLSGKPSITVTSYEYDREDNALRLQELGCGVHLGDDFYRHGMSIEYLGHVVRRVAGDERIAAATRGLAKEIAAAVEGRGAREVIRLVEEHLSSPKRRRRRLVFQPQCRRPFYTSQLLPMVSIYRHALLTRLARAWMRWTRRNTS